MIDVIHFFLMSQDLFAMTDNRSDMTHRMPTALCRLHTCLHEPAMLLSLASGDCLSLAPTVTIAQGSCGQLSRYGQLL